MKLKSKKTTIISMGICWCYKSKDWWCSH